MFFCLDFEKLGNEEWIVFRKKSYLLEEFLFDWQTKLQKLEPTPLVTRILKEIQNYQVIYYKKNETIKFNED